MTSISDVPLYDRRQIIQAATLPSHISIGVGMVVNQRSAKLTVTSRAAVASGTVRDKIENSLVIGCKVPSESSMSDVYRLCASNISFSVSGTSFYIFPALRCMHG